MFYKISILLGLLVVMSSCAKGDKGDQGPEGNPALDTSDITTIRLCTSCTPTYPSTFPEYALCIENELYGVYSDHGGFLALLPPGTYRSNGVGCDCNVTVEENCQVTQ